MKEQTNNIIISIIIPTHKRKEYLLYEIEQIYKQKDICFEIIVVNDIEHEDPTDDIIQIYPNIIYIKDRNIKGPSQKHKIGFNIAKGKYIYMPDDDDYLIDDYFFKKAVHIMEKDETISFVSGNVYYKIENSQQEDISLIKQPLEISGKIDRLLYIQNFQYEYRKPASTISTVFRKSALNTNMIEMSDSSIYLEALFQGHAYIIDDFVGVYRTQTNSLTSNSSLEFILNVLRQKELFYYKSKKIIQNPKQFWMRQFELTYKLFINKPNDYNSKIKILIWGYKHSKNYPPFIWFLIKSTFNLIKNFVSQFKLCNRFLNDRTVTKNNNN